MKYSLYTLLLVAFLTSCKKEIPGCTDYSADNYNSAATDNDGSCQYSGDLTFWMSSQMNYIDVTCNGYTQTITVYYPSGNVTCGSAGCANFHLPVGTYNYYAEEQGTFNYWAASTTVQKNGCKTILLY